MIACIDRGGGGTERTDSSWGAMKPKAGSGGSATPASDPCGGHNSTGPVRVDTPSDPDRFALGAPCVVSRDSPPPGDFPAGRSDDEIRALFRRKSQIREETIRRILEESRASNQPVERFAAAIQYDSELAPRTNNRRQLLEIGIEVPAPDAIPSDDAAVHRTLWTIIYGLARLGIFLTGTDSYDDRALLARLCTSVLLDEVSDVPPSADMSEFIDVTPMDQFDGDDDEDRFDASPIAGSSLLGGAGHGLGPASDIGRDRLLPRPDRSFK